MAYKTKEAKREYEKRWYHTKGKEKRNLANKKWENKKLKEFKEFKATLSCERCGEKHIACLEFHHIDPLTKEGAIGQLMRKYSLERLKKEIEKCIVLCANCHRKEHYKENA